MDSKNWIAVGAASALSLGVMAGGAVSVANAMPLIENATGLSVPGVGAVTDDGAEVTEIDFSVSSDSIVSPASSSSPATPSPVSTDTAPSPVSVDSGASPVSPASPLSPVSVDTPPTPPTPASIASVPSPASVDSVD